MERLTPGRQLGTYQILGRLGAGGMGEVYRAKDLKLGRDVAIKVLPDRFTSDPHRLARFEREARLLAALNHPRIGAIYGLDEAADNRFLVLELVEGETLAHRIERGPLRIDESLAVVIQMAEALEAAHAKGIVHRDLKPSNVIVQDASARGETAALTHTPVARRPPDGILVKVLDFGLAKASAAASESPTVAEGATAQGAILGTTAYMSPEQAQGHAVDSRTDIWSLGVVLYEMVTGRPPFKGDHAHVVLYSIIHTAHEPMTAVRVDVPLELDRIVNKALAKNPDERYQHVDDLLVDLRTLARKAHSSSSTISTPAAVAARPLEKRLILAVSALAVLLLVAVGALAFLLSREPASRSDASVRRFSIPLGNTRPVISPDGRHIAYRLDGRLWVRDLDSETPREIPGGRANGGYYSDTGYYLTWSPNSEDIVFTAENELRRVSIVQGGSARTICPLPPGRSTPRFVGGIAWSSDGQTIVFSRYGSENEKGGIYEVPAIGGSPVLLWEEEHADDVMVFDTPQGRAVVFAVSAEAGHVLTVRTPDGRRREIASLEANWPELVYVPSGHILYRRNPLENPSIWAVPFSPTTLDTQGKPFLVERNGLGMSLSGDGTLVYLDFGKALGQFLVWRDRRGSVLAEAPEGHDVIQIVSLSPDGNRAVVSAVDAGRSALWIYDVQRFARTRFDAGPDAAGKPVVAGVWTKGNDIHYSVGDPPAQLFVKAVDGVGPARRVPFPDGLQVVTDRTADGRYVVVVHSPNPNTEPNLWLRQGHRADEQGEIVHFSQTSDREVVGVLSPNERYIAYPARLGGRVEIFVRPFPEGTGRWQVSVNGGSAPSWGPDGSELFFAEANKLMRVAVSTTGAFSVSAPASPLFEHAPLAAPGLPIARYDVARQGFLTVQHKTEITTPVVRVVEHWLSEFRTTAEQRGK
jgi:serine/threonine protein kinase